jgi:hypothetical protein
VRKGRLGSLPEQYVKPGTPDLEDDGEDFVSQATAGFATRPDGCGVGRFSGGSHASMLPCLSGFRL